MSKLLIVTMLWDPNDLSFEFSRCYDESWVEKLYRGFARNLNVPFRFVCFTDRRRHFWEPIEQEGIERKPCDYGCYIEPFRLNEPMILVGLDTLVIGNVDELAGLALGEGLPYLPRNPYKPDCTINAVAAVPKGNIGIYQRWRGEKDMEYLRTQETRFIDDVLPGYCVSLKAHQVRKKGAQGARILYFHGHPKPHELPRLDLVSEHWR